MIQLLAHPVTLLSRQQIVSLSQSAYVSPVELADWERGKGMEGAKSCDREKAWLSVNHSVLAEEEAPLTRGGERRLLKSSFICVVADGRWSEEGIFEWEFNCACLRVY